LGRREIERKKWGKERREGRGGEENWEGQKTGNCVCYVREIDAPGNTGGLKWQYNVLSIDQALRNFGKATEESSVKNNVNFPEKKCCNL